MHHIHRLAHAGLCAVHLAIGILLVTDGAFPHAGCALTAALLYLLLCLAA